MGADENNQADQYDNERPQICTSDATGNALFFFDVPRRQRFGKDVASSLHSHQ